jgi:hypothetical protein
MVQQEKNGKEQKYFCVKVKILLITYEEGKYFSIFSLF